MDLLFTYTQQKKESTGDGGSTCDLKLYSDDKNIEFISNFDFDYIRYGVKKYISITHKLNINLTNGDIHVDYTLTNKKNSDSLMYKSTNVSKKNSFKLLNELIDNGLYRGQKRIKYWGVKYSDATNKITDLISEIIKPKITNKFNIVKDYENNYSFSKLYDMIVDFHLDSKNIKGHNGIYNDIQYVYPKKKWLSKNDNKFLPSVLDSFGIKSKYLIGMLNDNTNSSINIETVNYLCKLFGDNHIDYLRSINWVEHCYETCPNKKLHTLENEFEKKSMIRLINSWDKKIKKTDSLIYSVNKLFSLRDHLKTKGQELKFNVKNHDDFEVLMDSWYRMKLNFSRGYKLRYNLPEKFITEIESVIEIDNKIFEPKLIITEENFIFEGHDMKNCMGDQFSNGIIFIYVSLKHKKKKINLQYKKGELTQSYGKANSKVLEMFNEPINVLSNRFKKYKQLTWKKEKYDFI
jgi:hypothetical protein